MNPKIRQSILIGFAVLITSFVIWSAQAPMPPDLLAQGEQQWAAGELDQAQKSFEQALQAQPRSVSAHMKLAGLQLSRQQFTACIDTYQRAIGLDANNARVWLGLGFAYLHTGQDALAMAAFNQAVRADPSTQEKLAPLLAKLMGRAPSAD